MTMTATYNNDISRVQIALSGATGPTDYAIVERSTDGITWTTIRGGDKVPITSGSGKIDDYEFTAGVLNTYRATYIDAGLIPSIRGTATTVTGNNVSLTPANVTGLVVGDLKLVLASIRNQGVGVVGPAPTGWTEVFRFQNMALFAKVHVTADAAPTITFTGGVAGADTIATMSALTGALLFPDTPIVQNNASAQNIAGPTYTPGRQGVMVQMAWKQATLTSTTGSIFATKIADVPSTAGTGASMTWSALTVGQVNLGVPFSPYPITVTGGSAAISTGAVLVFASNLVTGTDSTTVTPQLVDSQGQPVAWIKFPSRPGLNAQITITDCSPITRKARTGLFNVLGRTMPVAVNDLQTSRTFSIEILVRGNAEASDMDNRLSTGDPIFLQMPSSDYDVPTVYAVTGDIDMTRLATGSTAITFTIPLTEVAAPGTSVHGDTYVWQDVINNYATWADVIAGNSSWSNLQDKVSDSVVIVT